MSDRDLEGLDKLVAAYRRLPQPEPGPELDAAVLAKARAALAPKRSGARWPAVFATAAALVAAVGLTWQFRDEVSPQQPAPLASGPAEGTPVPVADAAKSVATAEAPRAQEIAQAQREDGTAAADGVVAGNAPVFDETLPMSEPAPPPPAAAPAPAIVEQRAAPVHEEVERDAATGADRQTAAAEAEPFPADAKDDSARAAGESRRVAAMSGAAAPSPTRAEPPAAPASAAPPGEPQAELARKRAMQTPEAVADERAKPAPETGDRDNRVPAKREGALGATAASEEKAAAASELESVAVVGSEVRRTDIETSQPVFVIESGLDPEIQRDAKRWLREIRNLRERGELERARIELAAFRRAWPDEKVPRELEELER